MPIDKRPLKVFLCHAHADRDAVHALYTRLTNDGVDAWLDKEKLLPGQDWELEIKKAVREADVVVVCLSKQFNQAGFRQKEVRLALDTAMEKPEGEIFIIPARLEECDNLESLRKWHWVDLFEEDGYEMLMRALRTRADTIGAKLQIKKKQSKIIEIPDLKSNKTDVNKKITQSTAHESVKDFMERHRARMFRISLVGLIVVFLWTFAPRLISQLNKPSKITSTSSITSSLTNKTPISVSETITPTVFITSTQAQAVTPTSLPAEITDAKGVSMLLVSAGEFTMGIDLEETIALCKYYYWNTQVCEKQPSSYTDQTPPHQVFLNAYYIDKYEVTNALYAACVKEGFCSLPEKTSSYSRDIYYGNSTYDNYPVWVNWEQADIFCKWRDARLPTEAEWEKAARGMDERVFPWGNTINCENANFSNCGGSMNTLSGGSYEKGKSMYGVYDMAGNYINL